MTEAQPALFISHASDGKIYANKLKAALEAREMSVQMAASDDESSLEAPDIETQIGECATYLLVMTPEAKDSEAVTAELAIAQKLAKPILPILLAGDPWPELATLEPMEALNDEAPTEQILQKLDDYLLADLSADKSADLSADSAAATSPEADLSKEAETKSYPARRKVLTWAALAGGGLIAFGALGQLLKGRQEAPISEEDGRGDRSSATDANRTLQTANGDGAPGMDEEGVIKIGLLHSLSGTMAISETALVDAEELAIEEINAAGGVLGRQIVAVLEDGASDWPTFTEKTEKLIEVNNVAAVFGCWTSASRKAVLSLFEDKNHMLWYPLAYEGQECSKNVFYTGAVPNQQLEPAINWLLDNEKENAFFLVGAEDDFFRAANDIIQAQLKVKGTGETTDEATDEGAGEGSTKATELAGEVSVPFGRDVAKAIAQIKADLPEGGIIINTLHGDDNVSFFRQLKRDGLEPEQYPVMSVSMAEEEIRQIGPEFLTGHYATWNYFQTVESETNDAWVANFKSAYGEGRVTSDPMAAAYTAVYLWKQAVEAAGTTNISAVREAAYGQTFEAPGGTVTLQPNHHLTKPVRIGKIREDGLFEIVWTTEEPIPPTPWNQYVADTKGYACDWSDNSKGGKYQPPATEKAEP